MANAEQLQQQSEIIAAIEASSEKELKQLIEIKRLLRTKEAGKTNDSGLTIKRQFNANEPSANDRNYKPNKLGLRIISERKNVKTRTRDNKITLDLKPISFNEFYKKRDPFASRRNPKETQERAAQRRTRKNTRGQYAGIEHEKTDTQGGINKSDHPSNETKPNNANAERKTYATGAKRDSNGRFVGKSANEKHTEQSLRDRERAEDIKAQEGLWQRVGGYLGDLKDKGARGEDGATDMAGVAAGGVFWSAGKEILEVSKNAVGSAVSLTDFLKKKEEDGDDKSPTERPVTRQPDRIIEPSSVEQIARKKEGDEARKEEKKARKLQDENEKQTELLEELLDETKKNEKKGSSLLGKLAGLLGLGALSDFLGGDGSGKPRKDKAKSKNKTKTKPAKAKPKGGALSKVGKGVLATTAAVGGYFGYEKVKDSKAEKAAAKAEEKAAAKVEQTAAQQGVAKVEKIAATKVADDAAGKIMAQSASKSASMVAKSIPLLGTAYSAFDGALDHEAHNAAFGEGNVGTQQELSYSAMNIIDFGGLTSGAFGLLADGLEMAGMSPETTNEWVRLDPAQAARTMDDAVTTVIDAADKSTMALMAGSKAMADFSVEAAKTAGNGIVSGVKGAASFSMGAMATSVDGISSAWHDVTSFFGADDPNRKESEVAQAKERGKSAGEIAAKGIDINDEGVIDAVKSGTKETVSAIKDLSKQITLAGGFYGQDNIQVPAGGVAPSPVAKNIISSDLNIGGVNAAVRSFRNNNFGNLQFVGQAGATLENKNAKGEARFAKFGTPEEGMRALANQLNLYSEGKSKAAGYKKLNTVEDIINLYAPSNENDTKGYIKNLSSSLGVGKNDQLNLSDPAVMTKMIRSIATIEGGNPQVTDEFIKSAIGQRNGAGKWQGQFSDESLTAINKKRAERGLPAISRNDQYSNPEIVKGGNIPAASTSVNSAPSAVPTVAPMNPEDSPAVPATQTAPATQAPAQKEPDALKALEGGAEEQLSLVEGLRNPSNINSIQINTNEKTLSKEAMEKEAQAKQAKAASSFSGLPPAPSSDDPEAQKGWFDQVMGWAENATNEQLEQVEGLRHVDTSSGIWSYGSGGNGGAGGGKGGGVASVNGGYGSLPYDYGEPSGYVSQKEGQNSANASELMLDDPDAIALDAAIEKTNRMKVEENDQSLFGSFGDLLLGAASDTLRGAVGYFDTQNLAELGLSDMGVSREVLGRVSPITSRVAEHANNSIRTGLNTSADSIDVFRAGGDVNRTEKGSDAQATNPVNDVQRQNAQNNQKADAAIGFGGILTDALGDTVQSVSRGIDLRAMGDELFPEMGISRDVMSKISPISDKIYNQANQSIWDFGERSAEGIRSVKPIQDSPAVLPTITDHSVGAAASTLKTGSDNTDIIKQLMQLNKNISSLLSETKKKDKGGNANTISNTPQPQPQQRGDIPLASNSGAMNAFLGDNNE